MQLYEITHTLSNMKYIGITYKENKTYLDRFNEHMKGEGSIFIKELILSGEIIDNFSISLLYTANNINELFILETEYIKHNIRLGCSMNKNYGGGFIGKKYFLNSIYKEYGYDVNIYQEKHDTSMIVKNINSLNNTLFETKNYTDKLCIKRTLSSSYKISHLFSYVKDIISYFDFYKIFMNNSMLDNIYNLTERYHIFSTDIILNYILPNNNSNYIIYDLKKKLHKKRQKINKDFFNYFFLSKHANIKGYFYEEYKGKINHSCHVGKWDEGREKYRERVNAKNFTNAEKERFKKTKIYVKEFWETVSKDEKHKRTKNGLDTMNNKIHVCVHCKKGGLGLGNLNRHHNNNCKYRNKDE